MDAELERMVVKLVGDMQEYETMLEKAEKETKGFVSKVQGHLDKLGNSLTHVGKVLTIGLTAPIAGLAAGAVSEFMTMETTALRLSAAIEANGGSVGKILPDYQQFASEIQKVTRVGDDSVLALLQEAESLGLTGEQAKRAAKNAVALASAKGMSEKAAIRMTIALEQGREEMLQRYIPSLRGLKTEAERVAKAQQVLGGMFGVAKADAQSMAGQIDQLKNDFGDLMEEIVGNGCGCHEASGLYSKGWGEVVSVILSRGKSYSDRSCSSSCGDRSASDGVRSDGVGYEPTDHPH